MSEEKIASKYIDKDPPMGTEQQLERKNNDYLAYLKEKLNFILSNYGRRLTDADGHISELIRTASEFALILSQKVDGNQIIASINMSPEQITIDANKVNISGFVTFSNLSTSGETTINGENVTTGLIQDASGNNYWDLNSGEIVITKGHINIATSSETQDLLRFNGGGYTSEQTPRWYEVRRARPTVSGEDYVFARIDGVFGVISAGYIYNDEYFARIQANGTLGLLKVGGFGQDGNVSIAHSSSTGTSSKIAAELTPSGLTFKDTSGNVTATYPASGGGGSDIETQSFTKNLGMSIAAGGSGSIDFTITKSGYTPIGITGIWGSGTTGMVWNDFFLVDNNKARIWYYNAKSSASTLNSLSIKVLYKKN